MHRKYYISTQTHTIIGLVFSASQMLILNPSRCKREETIKKLFEFY